MVRPIVTAAADAMRPAIDAKGIAFDALIGPDVPILMGDPDRLQQVFWNLLANAVKFTPRGGRIVLTAHRVDSRIEITLSDTGAG